MDVSFLIDKKNRHMKKIIIYSILLLSSVIFYACNDEWKDEQYHKYVSFTRSGYVNTYLNYNAEGGLVTYRIPIEISGSTGNNRDVQVTIGVDPDTLNVMNQERYYTREDLYFRLLDPKYYEFKTKKF